MTWNRSSFSRSNHSVNQGWSIRSDIFLRLAIGAVVVLGLSLTKDAAITSEKLDIKSSNIMAIRHNLVLDNRF